MLRLALPSALFLLGTAAGIVACSATSDDAPNSAETAIIAGVDAKGHALDAIGALTYQRTTDPAPQIFCTATLIAPKLIATARRCAIQTTTTPATADGGAPTTSSFVIMNAGKVLFNTGWDAHAPARSVGVESVETCGLEGNGYLGAACDVAIYRLSEAVTDIAPIPFATLAADRVGTRLSVVGYGDQLQTADQFGTRKAGSVTLRAITGSPMKASFPTLDAFVEAYTAQEGAEAAASLKDAFPGFYERKLMDGYEVYAGGAQGDAQTCSIDTGGPLLAVADGKLTMYGIASSPLGGTKQRCLTLGTAFAADGPKVQELVDTMLHDPCEAVPAGGACEGDVAVRCTRPNEGPRRVTRNDCGEVLQHCVRPAAPGGEVSCAD